LELRLHPLIAKERWGGTRKIEEKSDPLFGFARVFSSL